MRKSKKQIAWEKKYLPFIEMIHMEVSPLAFITEWRYPKPGLRFAFRNGSKVELCDIPFLKIYSGDEIMSISYCLECRIKNIESNVATEK